MSFEEKGKQVYTVKQVNYYIKQIFDGDFILRSISVKGEISNCKYHSSGHIYFSLKDDSGVISCVMFASNAAGLRFRLEDGKQVVVTGNVSVYEASGRYQLYAKKIEEEGQGDLFLKFEALKKQLSEAGFFANEYKKPIPKYGYKIGVVTSQTGAVIRDIYNVASRRNPYAQIFLYPAQVQGEGAERTIAAGIEVLDRMGLDVIIIGRGGGSIEDLWAFNEEVVARAIFQSTTPVISAVGHETDYTIADFVADMRAPTPSAAAELAVFDYSQFEKELADLRFSLKRNLQIRLERSRSMARQYRLLLENYSPDRQLMQMRQKTADYRDALDEWMEDRLASCKDRVADAAELIGSVLPERLQAAKDRTAEAERNLQNYMDRSLTNKKMRLALVSERLSGMSPLKRLSEGYAYVSLRGKTLKSVSQVKPQDEISVALKDGYVGAVVKTVEPQEL